MAIPAWSAASWALLPDWLTAAWVWVVFLMVTGFLVFLFVALWLREDADGHGMNGIAWAIMLVAAGTLIPFIGGVAVLVVYFLMRMEHPGRVRLGGPSPAPATPPPPVQAPPAMSCKTCGAPVASGAAFCANCGSKV